MCGTGVQYRRCRPPAGFTQVFADCAGPNQRWCNTQPCDGRKHTISFSVTKCACSDNAACVCIVSDRERSVRALLRFSLNFRCSWEFPSYHNVDYQASIGFDSSTSAVGANFGLDNFGIAGTPQVDAITRIEQRAVNVVLQRKGKHVVS